MFKDGYKIASIGAAGMNDYPTYIRTKGIKYANERKHLYKVRHKNDRNVKNTNGWYGDKILW